jgi:hypothetical protein
MIDVESFIQQGISELGPYVSGVWKFIERLGTPQGLEKSSLRSRPVEAYIRNMLAVGVLSRIMRDAFIQTERKIIVLPDCLKDYGEWECCKQDLGNESECTQCTPDCIVYETMERFGNSHIAIVLEPDNMEAYFGRTRESYGTVGIIGVACALTMLSGFEKTIKYKHPTQGVFLNYSSCAHHWADPAYNTNFSLKRMAWVLHNNGSFATDEIRDRGETYSLEKPPLTPDDFYRRLDSLADSFEKDYLPLFREASPEGDIYKLCEEAQVAIVPDLITRDSA